MEGLPLRRAYIYRAQPGCQIDLSMAGPVWGNAAIILRCPVSNKRNNNKTAPFKMRRGFVILILYLLLVLFKAVVASSIQMFTIPMIFSIKGFMKYIILGIVD